MAKNLYTLNQELTSEIHRATTDHKTAHEIVAIFNQFMARSVDSLTPAKNRRYPQYYASALHQVYAGLMQQFRELSGHIVFGYWFEDEFYTTRKKQCSYTIYQNYVNPGLKTTEDLRVITGNCAQWDHLVSGMFYAENKKEYFIS